MIGAKILGTLGLSVFEGSSGEGACSSSAGDADRGYFKGKEQLITAQGLLFIPYS